MRFVYRVIGVTVTMWLAKVVADAMLSGTTSRKTNLKLDEMSSDSFPSSDAPSSWAGPDVAHAAQGNE